MIIGELKSQVDKIWEAFWTGGISNPLSVIEQFKNDINDESNLND
jgi:type I restriction enzyme M protein